MIPIVWSVARRRMSLLARRAPARAVFEAVLRLAHRIVLSLGALADDVLARSWRDVTVTQPIFILGHQRTGTTVIHRELGRSPDLTGSSLAWLLFPSVTLHRLGRSVARVDRLLGRPLTKVLRIMENRLLAPLDPLHVTRLGLLEEDEFVFWATFGTTMAATDHPATLGAVDARRTDLPVQHQRRLLDWYAMSVRKRVYLEGGRYIGKNPAASNEVAQLASMFPDATFVVLTREREAAIGSRQRLVQAIWDRAGLGKMAPGHVMALRADSERTLDAVGGLAGPNVLRVDHSAIVGDLSGVVADLALRLGVRVPQATGHPQPD